MSLFATRKGNSPTCLNPKFRPQNPPVRPDATVGSLPVDARVDPEFRPCRFELSGETSRRLSHGREAVLPCVRSNGVHQAVQVGGSHGG